MYGRDFQGGRLIFGALGCSVCADHGYSVHGRFKLLEHAVSTILPLPNLEKPPLRISVALYSHAEVYAGPARVSAARKGISISEFSDSSMWIPFPSKKFSLNDCCEILKEEEKGWRKKYWSHVAVKNFAQSLEG